MFRLDLRNRTYPHTRFVLIIVTSLLFAVIAGGAGRPATLENNDSCDISVTPAATLLLPYFEVDLDDPAGETTVFSVTNVHGAAQIARVTLWTDFSYPVITFNIYLTGYDVQKVNLYEVLAGGGIALPRGTGTTISPTGDLSVANPLLDLSQCGVIPSRLDATAVARMHDAFTTGSITGVCDAVGHEHQNAIGYATIDVVGDCDATGPTDPEYFTSDIRYDNALIGDYQQVNSSQNFAQGSPMVHIRAIPEGSTPQLRAGVAQYQTTFDRTFYGRLQSSSQPKLDARQPLPRTFAARWINGGIGEFQTSLKIWRQGRRNPSGDCAVYEENMEMVVAETIVFDEHENGEGNAPEPCDITCIGPPLSLLPNTSLVAVEPGSETFPQSIVSTTVSGWVYLNLYDIASADLDGQAWVVSSMRSEGRYSVDFDAAWLGNGCSPDMLITSYSNPALPPVGNAVTPTYPGAILPGPGPDVVP
jgi:hypothetical protein